MESTVKQGKRILYALVAMSLILLATLGIALWNFRNMQSKQEDVVDGNWGEWRTLRDCSNSCVGTKRNEYRQCENPTPSNNGKYCSGPSTRETPCGKNICSDGKKSVASFRAPKGSWGVWFAVSKCPSECAEHMRFELRICNKPPTYGKTCKGKNVREVACGTEYCKTPTDGGYSTWSMWSVECTYSTYLKKHVRRRTRTCNEPPPKNGGKDCAGAKVEFKKCSIIKETAPTRHVKTTPNHVNTITQESCYPCTNQSSKLQPSNYYCDCRNQGPVEDCQTGYNSGFKINGVYKLLLRNNINVDIFCEDGWTVIQRRNDGSVNFQRNWSDYKRGFGDVSNEFWVGNDVIYELTRVYSELMVSMVDSLGNSEYAFYKNFRVQNEDSNYKLTVSGYSGTAGNALREHNNQQFSTKDADHDNDKKTNCAARHTGGWWFHSCMRANLNGKYYTKGEYKRLTHNGIHWYAGRYEQDRYLKSVTMKIRRF